MNSNEEARNGLRKYAGNDKLEGNPSIFASVLFHAEDASNHKKVNTCNKLIEVENLRTKHAK